MQNDIAAEAVTGPHIDAPRIDPAARRAEIDYMLSAANAKLPKATLKKLGGLSLAPASEDDDSFYFAQIRSGLIGKSGCEFRFSIPARDTGRRDLDTTIARLVGDAGWFANVASGLRPVVSNILKMAEETIAPAIGGIARMRVVAIGMTPIDSRSDFKATIDVEMLGRDLTPGIERVTDDDTDRLNEKLAELVAKHLARRKLLAQAKVAGASGWVDDAALRIIDAAGFDRAEILGMMRTQREIEFSFGGKEGHDISGALYWQDGVIRSFAERRKRGATFGLEGSVLGIEAVGLPGTIIADMIGRRLREVVDLALIPKSALIVDFTESEGWLYLELEIGRTTIETAVATPA
jgi:hypothetical protein